MKNSTMLGTLLNFLFPNTCINCGVILPHTDSFLCENCKWNLSYTHWPINQDNLLYQKLAKFTDIEGASSLLYYRKNSGSQEILHNLKYRGRQEIGERLAKEVHELAQLYNSQFDGITYVPIHDKKLKQRGYNQNYTFAKTLSELMQTDLITDLLERKIHQKSQTTLHRGERFQNLKNTYTLKYFPTKIKHILLIDDVCTTGSTLIHCVQLFRKCEIKVSVLTMAYVD